MPTGRQYCFITGFLRSGTTLVEKLAHALPEACIGSQPFPFLYYDTKRAFLRLRGLPEERYPLGHLFGESRYLPEDFHAFLAAHRVTPQALATSFAAMRGYSGWQLPAIARYAERVAEDSFAGVYRQLCDQLPGLLGRSHARLLGAKEVFCEEFIAYFLAQGIRVVLVLRDIRDVLTSLKFGGGAAFGNRELSVLHIVRQWRKSVAFALEFSGHAGFEALRYEQLVGEPRAWLDRRAAQWGLAAAAAGAIEELRDQEGSDWQSNSSFAPTRGVSRESVGRFATYLPPELLGGVEWLCQPEMQVLGLEPAGKPNTSLADIDERRRRELIARGDAPESEQRLYCIFPRAYRSLADSGVRLGAASL